MSSPILHNPPSFVQILLGFPKTIFLFSQSDTVPILGPSLAVSMVLAGPTDPKAFICGFLWLELHLLTFEMIGLEEDRLSKPNRPIVSGRISLESAKILYLCVGALSFLYSVYHRVVLCSAIYMVAIYCYNERGMAGNWFLKSFLGSFGYMCYCWGTTIIFDHGNDLSRTSVIAVAISGLVHTTTGHAQDFRDRFGDAAIGRKTLAILLPPRFARWSLMGFFILDHSVEADRKSYWWYNMWLITAHFLPIFKRIAGTAL
ncbi:UbiA prenyltransferase family-domain-containing protein [Mycena rosella]|uniref:UbiA prenyltransferase family-domain-containing protein n=1 Tax=Mycena rosella TaxID=1033263 RepID=A0AAD7DNT6_MYCRO|nr:UbiA prenyltransferase family-domain-containing protein [Mycena rosella]